MNRMDWALGILRLTIGGVFLAHGIQKILAWGMTGGVPFFRDAGIPVPEIAAPLVAGIETVAGAAVFIGLATRPAAGLLGIVMLAAAFTVHLPYGFFLPQGAEFVLTLAGACLVLILAGPGRLSLDAEVWKDGRDS